jgi:hypothetical protein
MLSPFEIINMDMVSQYQCFLIVTVLHRVEVCQYEVIVRLGNLNLILSEIRGQYYPPNVRNMNVGRDSNLVRIQPDLYQAGMKTRPAV